MYSHDDPVDALVWVDDLPKMQSVRRREQSVTENVMALSKGLFSATLEQRMRDTATIQKILASGEDVNSNCITASMDYANLEARILTIPEGFTFNKEHTMTRCRTGVAPTKEQREIVDSIPQVTNPQPGMLVKRVRDVRDQAGVVGIIQSVHMQNEKLTFDVITLGGIETLGAYAYCTVEEFDKARTKYLKWEIQTIKEDIKGVKDQYKLDKEHLADKLSEQLGQLAEELMSKEQQLPKRAPRKTGKKAPLAKELAECCAPSKVPSAVPLPDEPLMPKITKPKERI